MHFSYQGNASDLEPSAICGFLIAHRRHDGHDSDLDRRQYSHPPRASMSRAGKTMKFRQSRAEIFRRSKIRSTIRRY